MHRIRVKQSHVILVGFVLIYLLFFQMWRKMRELNGDPVIDEPYIDPPN